MSDAAAIGPNPPAANTRRLFAKLIRMAASPALWIAALFLGAGRLDWIRGWICLTLYVAGMAAVGVVVCRFNAPLLEAREKWHLEDTKRFDKIFLTVLIPLTFVQPAVAGLDAVRFRWSPLSFGFVYGGALLFSLAIALIAWTLAINRHAETSVRIQTDRGHTVVTSGPYRVVRHPMYVGAILMNIATPLILGSLWAFAVTGAIVILFVWRTALEDRTLLGELSGYGEFASRTRFRLLPGLW